VKDGTGWGAHVGVSAALLARDGLTGAPALTVEREDARGFWSDLGKRWRIREQYFKAYPVCRWAQPAVEAALALQRAHKFAADDVAALSVESFREAVALGSGHAFSRLFPTERWARVRVTLADGRRLVSEPAVARGSAENPLSDAELLTKYRSYAEPVLGPARAARIEHAVHRLASEHMALTELLEDLLEPIA